MSKVKNIISISNKLSDYIVTATGDCLDKDEQDYLYDDLFEKFHDLFKNYDRETLETLDKNL